MRHLRKSHLAWIAFLSVFVFVVGCGSQSSQTSSASDNQIDAVGFDLDDTLIFSTPAFQRGFEQAEEPFSAEFWRIVNKSDRGRSCVKPRTVEILESHRDKGREIYVITAREPHGPSVLKQYVSDKFDIPTDHVFLEPDGKTKRLKKLGIDIYYGDSDSDISDAQEGGIKAVRIKRHPESDYEKKNNPGKFDEKVIPNSTGHRCPS